MLREVVSNADLTIWPKMAMVIFLGVFAMVVYRVLRHSSADQIGVDIGQAPVTVAYSADVDLVPFVAAARAADPIPTIFQTGYAWAQLAITFDQIRSGDDVAGALLDAAVEIRDAPEPPEPAADEDA